MFSKWSILLFGLLLSPIAGHSARASNCKEAQIIVDEEQRAIESLKSEDDYKDRKLSEIMVEIHQTRQKAAQKILDRHFSPFYQVSPEEIIFYGHFDELTPVAFACLMKKYPTIIKMTLEYANVSESSLEAILELGYEIRGRGISTHVPKDGYVGGAIELFLAGQKRTVEEGAVFVIAEFVDEFDKHSPIDDTDPDYGSLISYYTRMGVKKSKATEFLNLQNQIVGEEGIELTIQQMKDFGILKGEK